MHIARIFLLYATFLLFNAVRANVEKTIFIAPPRERVPAEGSNLDDLGLDRLSPLSPAVRTQLNASFPKEDNDHLGSESWFYLENLNPGQRYEVRVCWLASQPTTFTLSTYTIGDLFENPSLITAVTRFTSNRLASQDTLQLDTIRHQAGSLSPHAVSTTMNDDIPTSESVIFLRIHAAADYFTLHRDLMKDVPPVSVDVILDPYLLNVLPRSLVPTACWVGVVAIVAVLVARRLAGYFRQSIVEAEAGMAKSKKEG